MKTYKCIMFLSVFGILLAVYLLWQQFYQPAIRPCSINSWINCDAVITGPVAQTFGISTPLYGLIGYVVIFYAAATQKKKLLLSMATFGLIFCLWIAYKELFELRVICPVCIACQTIMITIFSLTVRIVKRSNLKR